MQADRGPVCPLGRAQVKTIGLESFLAERQGRGARRVDLGALMEQGEIVFRISPHAVVSQLCIDCMEFMSSAARDASAAVDVLDRLEGANDRHLDRALRKYVEDTGLALKEVDNRLKNAGSSLAELFPEVPDTRTDSASWRDLIGRRDVIAHRILSVDDVRVRREAQRDFRTLYRLLGNINFVPTVTDWDNGRLFDVRMRTAAIRRLPPVEPGGPATEIGTSVILVCEDIQHGLLTFRVARSAEDQLLFSSSRVGSVSITVQFERSPAGPSE